MKVEFVSREQSFDRIELAIELQQTILVADRNLLLANAYIDDLLYRKRVNPLKRTTNYVTFESGSTVLIASERNEGASCRGMRVDMVLLGNHTTLDTKTIDTIGACCSDGLIFVYGSPYSS